MEQQRQRARGPSMGDHFGPETPDRKALAQTAAPGGPAGQSAFLAKGTQVGEYVIESKIGEGAMGTVYRAVHPAIGRHVAIKVMTPKLFDEPESEKRFVSEARAVAAIRHPGIVDVFGFGRLPDRRTYLVMEWLKGTSLAEELKKRKVPFDEACDMLRQIARALEAAHSKGVVHRDLKPENVFIHHIDDEKPQCKLLDFGLAKTTNKEDGLVARTRTGQLLGTPLYMSPEQCKSKGVDHRTDIYALGCMAYEMLAGRVPFDCDNVAELISAHLVADPPPASKFAPEISPVIEKLLLRMIAKDPDERPTLAEVRKTISSVLTTQSQTNATVDEMTPPPPAPPGTLSTGSSPAIPLPTGAMVRIGKTPTGQVPLVPTPEVPAPAPERGAVETRQLPWIGILGALVIVAIAVAAIAFLR